MGVFSSRQETGLPKPKYEYVTTESRAREVLSLLDQYPIHAIDTEATALDPYAAKWSLLQIGVPDNAFVFDVRYDTQHSNIHPELFDDILQDPNKLRIMQNAAYDMKIIKRSRNYYVRNIYDTMLAEQLINLGLSFKKASLEALVDRYIGVNMDKEPRNTFADYGQKFEAYQLEYAINDVVPLHLIKDLQSTALHNESLEHASKLEFDFLVPLCEMELNGISIDSDKWNIIMGDVDKDRLEIKAIIQEMLSSTESQTTLFGVSLLNIDSNLQLKEALNKYGIDLANTSQPTLSKFAGIPVIDAILDYRKAEKLISTYAQSLLDKINPVTGRLHTDFKQMVSTGRMSSANPNLQNIPKKQKYRSCFVAKEGSSLITCDMSSAELRILGNLSRDPVFLECFKNNIDLHTRSASEIFKVPMNAVDESMRDACKALSFGLMYGLSKFGLARRLKITETDAQSLINNYFNVFKNVKKYLDKSATDAVMRGYSLSISGRRRYYSRPANDHPDRDKIINSIKRQAMNAPIQGSLVFDSNVKGLGSIGKYVGKEVFLETGFGRDKAVGVFSGVKDVYDLKLSNGSNLGITLEHKIPVVESDSETLDIVDKRVDALTEKDFILIPLKVEEGTATDLFGYNYVKGHWRETYVSYKYPDKMNSDLAFIVGCLIGDGSYTKHNHFRFVCSMRQIEIFNKFNTCVERQFGYKPVIITRDIDDKHKHILMGSQVSSVVIRGFLKHIGLDYTKGLLKSIPEYFYSETIENKGALLNGLFSTDGGVTKESGPNYTTISKKLAVGIQQLLLSLGINSNLKTYSEEKRTVYRLQISKRFNYKFNKYIGFSTLEKSDKLEINIPISGKSLVPECIPKLIAHILVKSGIYKTLSSNDRAHIRRFKYGECSYNSWRKFYKFMPECVEKKQLSFFLNYDFCNTKSLVYRGKEPTYDLMCDNIHYFIADGVVVHNSNADTIKKSMIYLVDRLEKSGLDARLILTVHDEVIIETANECKKEVSDIVSQSIVDGFNSYFSLITMESEAVIGPSWLKSKCKAKKNNVKCGNTEMIFVPDTKYGTKLVCNKCGSAQE